MKGPKMQQDKTYNRNRAIVMLAFYILAAFWVKPAFADARTDSTLRIKEEDGSPSKTPHTLKVTNGTLTDNGDGTVSLSTGAGGGSGDVTSVGDCADGACYDGSSDGGTYARLYDGDSNYGALVTANLTDNRTYTFPNFDATMASLAGTETLTNKTLAAADNVIGADTAVALAANGSNCSAGSAPLGVDASGAAESCTDYEEDLSNSAGLRGALSDESGTGAAIFADGAIGAATATTPAANDDDTSVATTAYVQTEMNAAGGNFLTCASGSCDVDAEAVTDTVCFRITSPTGTDFQSAWVNRSGKTFTVSDLWCESDQTVNMMTQVDDGSVADMDTVDLACISTPDTDSSLDGDATVANGDTVDIDVASVSGTPTWVEFCMTGAYSD